MGFINMQLVPVYQARDLSRPGFQNTIGSSSSSGDSMIGRDLVPVVRFATIARG